MNSNLAYERQSLVPSISSLNQETQQQYDEENLYATEKQAFYDQNLFQFVLDEVHTMMQIMFCQSRWCGNFYNPLFLLLSAILYIFTIPGALLHYLLLGCVPVRYIEHAEERELRSQGIYTAIGISLLSIPFDIYSIFENDSNEQVFISALSFIVNVAIIFFNFIALKAVADGLVMTIRVYIVTVWLIDAILVALTLFDLYTDYSYITVLDGFVFAMRILQIFVYTVIGAQCTQFWDMYANIPILTGKKGKLRDSMLASIEIIIGILILGSFIFVIVITEEEAWKLMSW
jgi:hypothetical protein